MSAPLAQSHPELVKRYTKLVELCWANGWEIWISSSTRSRQTQEDLYKRWRAGTYNVPAVANPNGDGGPCPPSLGDWRWRGSYHMPQADGYSHALDLGIRGTSWVTFADLAASCGLRQTVVNSRGIVTEPWHYQWCHRRVVFDAPALHHMPPEEDEEVKWTLVQPDHGTSPRYPNGHPLKGAWYNANNAGLAYHMRTPQEIQLALFFGAGHDGNGGAIQIDHEWFDQLLRCTGDANQNALQTRL